MPRLLLLLLVSVLATAQEYTTVTIENGVARVVVSTFRGAIERLELKGVRPLDLPQHLHRPGQTSPDVAVLGSFWTPADPKAATANNRHNWLKNDAGEPVYGLTGNDFAPWTILPGSQTAEAVSLTFRSAAGHGYVLTYRMDPVRPTVHCQLRVTNGQAAAVRFKPSLMPLNGIHQDYPPNEVGYVNHVWHAAGKAHGTLIGTETHQVAAEVQPDYVGLKSRFFAAWFTPGRVGLDGPAAPPAAPVAATGALDPGAGTVVAGAPAVGPRFRVDAASFHSVPHHDHQNLLTVTYEPVEVPTGRSLVQEWSITGSGLTDAELARLTEAERRMAVTDIMHSLFLSLSSGMTWVLTKLVLLVQNYGLAVVLLTLLIKGILYKLTFKQHASILKMTKLAPDLKYLQEQYKNDKQQLALKQMELWKKHGVNPLGGCLPMLIQIPIFIALYNTFNYSADMRGHGFLWIPDLTLPDQVIGVPLSFLGGWVLSLNPLPILYIIATAFMSFSTPIPPSTDPQQEQMAKMMRWMPIIFGIIFYNMPSGLVLYFTANAIVSTIEVKLIRRKLGMP